MHRFLSFAIESKQRHIGSGKSFHMLVDELSRNPHTGITLVSVIDLDSYDISRSQCIHDNHDPDSIIVDLRDDAHQAVFRRTLQRMWEGAAVYDIINVYEDVFDMVPLDVLNQEWIFRHINNARRMQFIKRTLDVIFPSSFLHPFIIYPFLYIAIKLDDGGPFSTRMSVSDATAFRLRIYKVRSMNIRNQMN
jgi:hypothetical protein